jgi:hypothetical protein
MRLITSLRHLAATPRRDTSLRHLAATPRPPRGGTPRAHLAATLTFDAYKNNLRPFLNRLIPSLCVLAYSFRFSQRVTRIPLCSDPGCS